jgi:hypothetical protein
VARALQRQEVILSSDVARLGACPRVAQRAKYPLVEQDIEAVQELGLGRMDGNESVLERLTRHDLAGSSPSHAAGLKAYSQRTAEIALANILVEHFRQQNIISWNGKAIGEPSDGLVVFNNFSFNAASFTFLTPTLKHAPERKPKPSPFVLDVYARVCTEDDVGGFVERIRRAGQNTVSRLTFLGAIAAFDFDPRAWNTARGAGLIVINLKQYFGDAALDALSVVQEILKSVAGNVDQTTQSETQRFAELLAELKTNPWVKDLRSFGFETLTGLVLHSEGVGDVQLNRKATTKAGMEREVDVSGHLQNRERVHLVECKAEGRKKVLEPEYVRKFFGETVPAYLRTYCSGKMPRECRAEIWTTGIIGPEAHQALKQISVKDFVAPRLLGFDDVNGRIPSSLSSCKRLLSAISID